MNLKYRVTLAISFILIGCGSKGESEPIPNPDRERSFVGTLTLNERVSDSMSAPLLTPGSLLLSGDRIFVSDFGDHRVKVFDRGGSVVPSERARDKARANSSKSAGTRCGATRCTSST